MVNIDGPIELVMCGVRLVVTSYLAVVFQGRGDPKLTNQRDCMIRLGVVFGIVYFTFNFLICALIIWINHFIYFTYFVRLRT